MKQTLFVIAALVASAQAGKCVATSADGALEVEGCMCGAACKDGDRGCVGAADSGVAPASSCMKGKCATLAGVKFAFTASASDPKVGTCAAPAAGATAGGAAINAACNIDTADTGCVEGA